MPAKSIKQRRLFAAAAHGATFPLAEKLRDSMSLAKLHEFSDTSEADLPVRVKKRRVSLRSMHDGT